MAGRTFVSALMLLLCASLSLAQGQIAQVPPPPPIPPGYSPGTIANGDFASGNLTAWATQPVQGTWFYGTTEGVTSLGGNNAALLHVQGGWVQEMMPGPYPPPYPGPIRYQSGTANIRQSIYIPMDATQVSLSYFLSPGVYEWPHDPYDPYPPPPPEYAITASPSLSVWLGSSYAYASTQASWATAVISVNAADRGKRVELVISGTDGGYCYSGGYPYYPPSTYGMSDVYLDYVSLDGTTPTFYSSTLQSDGGGWETAGNWSPQLVPHNSLSQVHDVSITPSAAGTAALTLSTPRTIQSLTHSRASDLVVTPAGALNVLENASVSRGAVRVNPGGEATTGTALVVGGTFTVGGGDDPAGLAVRNAQAQVKQVTVNRNGTFDLQSGANLACQSLSVGQGAVLYAQDATIARLANSYGSVSVNGTANFSGIVASELAVIVGNSYSGATGQVNVTNGRLQAPNMEVAGGSVNLIAGEFEGNLTLSNRRVAIHADAASTLRLSNLNIWYPVWKDARVFDVAAARVVLGQANVYTYLYVGGFDRGPTDIGMVSNFAMGSLELPESAMLECQPTGARAATYVHDLVLAPGSRLNLNGSKLYYTGQIINNGGTIVGGDVRQAYVRPAGGISISSVGFQASATANGYTSSAAFMEAADAESSFAMPDPMQPPGMVTVVRAHAFANLLSESRVSILTMQMEGGIEGPSSYGVPPPTASASVDGGLWVSGEGLAPGDLVFVTVTLNLRSSTSTPDQHLQWEISVSSSYGEYGDTWGASYDSFMPGQVPPTEFSFWAPAESLLNIHASMNRDNIGYYYGGPVNYDDTLEVVITPEPATLCLLTVAGMGLIARRRQRQ